MSDIKYTGAYTGDDIVSLLARSIRMTGLLANELRHSSSSLSPAEKALIEQASNSLKIANGKLNLVFNCIMAELRP